MGRGRQGLLFGSESENTPALKRASAADYVWLLVMATAPFAVATSHGAVYAAILVGVIVMSAIVRRAVRRLT